MNKTILDKVVFVALIVLNALFLVYWGILAYYSQLHYDDLLFLWKIREMSVFDFVKDVYFGRSGRFVGYFICGVKLIITDVLGFHQLWVIFYYLLGLSVSWLVVKDVKLSVTRIGLFMGMCFVYNLYILTNIDFPVFFWLCAMGYYLYLPLAVLLVKYLNEDTLKVWQWMIVIVIAVWVGGGNEAFTPIVLLLMFISGMYWWYSKGWNVKETWALPQVRRIVWVAVLMLVLFAIVVAAPGNYVRMRMGDTTEFIHPIGVIGWFKAITEVVVMFFYFMAFYVPYYLIVFALAYYVGTKTHYELPVSKFRIVILLVSVFVAYLIVSSLPNVYLYGGFGIQRSYTHIVFALLLTVIAVGFVLGNGKKPVLFGWLSAVGMAVLIAIMCVNIVKDMPSARAYGEAVDERIEYLCILRDAGQKETVVVDPLPIPYTEDPKHLIMHLLGKETPKPVLYYISDTGIEPNEYEYHMKRVLNLGFDFVIAEDANRNDVCE